MQPNRSRDLTYLKAYLREKSRHPFAKRDWPWGLIGPLGVIGIGAAAILLAEEMPGWLLLFFIPMALVAFVMTAVRISYSLQQPRNAAEEKELLAHDNARFLAKAAWSQQIQPFAARLLEGCAYHRARILAAVERPGWDQGHMATLRDQAVKAANEAMDDAMQYCVPYAGPGHSRGAAWKDLAQDFVEGQIGDALKRLQTMLEADRPGEIVDRRKLPTELWPVYDIAVKLQKLASEMESAGQAVHEPSIAPETSAIDQVLSNLAEIRQAEKELESDEQQLKQF